MCGMNPIHIALAFYDRSGDYARHVGVTLASVFANTSGTVWAHLLHDETLTAQNRERLLQIAEQGGNRLLFYPVNLPASLSEVEYGAATRGTVYRLKIPECLPLERVIYLDADLVVEMDIAELWDLDMNGCSLAAATDLDLKNWSAKQWERVRNIGVEPNCYFNSGVMLMDLRRIREQRTLLAELPEFVRRFPKAVFVDQDYLNWLFQNDYCPIDAKFNVYVDFYVADINLGQLTGKIWHWAGWGVKPWAQYCSRLDSLYWRYLLRTPWYREAESGLTIYQREIDRLKESRSWRMTKPYRQVGDWLKKMLGTESGKE